MRRMMYTHGIAFFLGLIVAVLISWRVWGEKPVERVVEWKERIVHVDGSVTAERRPDSHAKPVTAVPVGNKPTGTATIVIRDTVVRTVECPDGTKVQCPQCPDDTLWLTTSDGRQGTRVTAKVSGGKVIEQFIDVPIRMQKKTPWAAGVAAHYPFGGNLSAGACLQRSIGPAVLSGQVLKDTKDAGGWSVGVSILGRF